MRSRRGDRRTILARQLAAYLAVVQLGASRAAVGRVFRRNARSIGRAVEAIEDARDDPGFDAFVTGLEGRLENLTVPRLGAIS